MAASWSASVSPPLRLGSCFAPLGLASTTSGWSSSCQTRRNSSRDRTRSLRYSSPVFFIRQGDWEAFFGLLVPNNSIDVDAFTVDEVTGDIYASFDGTTGIPNSLVKQTSTSGATSYTINRGDVIRIPRAAYTPAGPYGIVTNPLPGFAELVLTQANILAMVTAANGPAGGLPSVLPVNTFSLDKDPAGGTSVGATTGFSYPNLLFTVDSSGGPTTAPAYVYAPAVYSTSGGGSFAVVNGITLNSAAALGMRATSFNTGFYAGCLDALDVITHTPTLSPFYDRPLHLDAFPTNALLGTNGPSYTAMLTGYISNAAPNTQLAILGGLYYLSNGSWVPRYDVSPFVGGYPDLYIDPFGFANPNCLIAPSTPPYDLGCQTPASVLLNGGANPVPVWTDPINATQNGDCCFTLDLTLVVPVGTPPFLPPPVIVFQAIDSISYRLSSPLSFQLN